MSVFQAKVHTQLNQAINRVPHAVDGADDAVAAYVTGSVTPASRSAPTFATQAISDTEVIIAWTNFVAGDQCEVVVTVKQEDSATVEEGDVTIEGSDERGLIIKRLTTLGTDVNPKYVFGRLVEGGLNSKVRLLMSADNVDEHAIFEAEGSGTCAAVRDGTRGSGFEIFNISGPDHCTARMGNTYPDIGIEWGAGGVKVASWSRASNTVTMIFEDDHKFVSGATMTLVGTDGDLGAGTFTITVTDTDTVTFSETGADRADAAPGTALYGSTPTDFYMRRVGGKVLDIGFDSTSKLVLYEDTLTLQPGVSLNVGGAILGSVGSGITALAAGRLTRGWNKFTIPKAVFTTAGLTQSLIVASLPAKGKVVEAIIVVDTSFALAASTLAMELGITGTTNNLLVSFLPNAGTRGLADAHLGTGLALASAVQGGYRNSMTSAVNLLLKLTSDSANLGAAGVTSLSTGTLTLYLNIDVAP